MTELSSQYRVGINYRDRLVAGLAAIDLSALNSFASELDALRRRGGTLWLCGNGGSAATASHMQVDMMFGVNPGVRSQAINDNSAGLTATGNDLDYTQVFSRQLSIAGEPNDVLLVISASGKSPNLRRAVAVAKELGMLTVGFLGFDGGHLAHEVDLCVLTPTAVGDYGVAEDLHCTLNHMLKEMLNTD